MNDPFEIIAAFADGEHVDANELKLALANENGREYLVDVLALRRLMGDPDGRLRSESFGGPSRFRSESFNEPKSSSHGHRWFAGLAAALVVASATAGFFAGRKSSVVTAVPTEPPAVSVQATPPELLIPAPSPNRVIRLQTGKDWTERAGSN